jgi:hypothetical protein
MTASSVLSPKKKEKALDIFATQTKIGTAFAEAPL